MTTKKIKSNIIIPILSFYALQHGRDTVTREDVNNVAIAEISTDTYALANSILEGKNEKALDALAVMKFNRVEPVIILSEVSKVICDLAAVRSMAQRGSSSAEIAVTLKMNEYRVKMYMNGSAGKSPARIKKALALCAEADAAIKLSPQGYQAIERLICAL
jgi:DNA polymerase III delta subunit